MPGEFLRRTMSKLLGRDKTEKLPVTSTAIVTRTAKRNPQRRKLTPDERGSASLDQLKRSQKPVFKHSRSGSSDQYSTVPKVGGWDSQQVSFPMQRRETPVMPMRTLPQRDLESTSPQRKSPKTQKLRRESVNLERSPLLLEVVVALSVGPSPHVRPDLIGKTIAGGEPVKGATTTANVGLRSSPTGFAVGAHKAIAPPGRYDKKHKKHKKHHKKHKKHG